MIRILLVDDHPIVIQGTKNLLEGQKGLSVVGVANNGEQAVAFCRANPVNIVMLDLNMPDTDSVDTLKRILRIDSDIKVIIFTAITNDPFPSRLLKAGASGYITKDITPDSLIHAIKAVNSGQRYMSKDISQRLALKSITNESDESPFSLLSEKELQVANMLIQGKEVKEIAPLLHISGKTVNTYKYRMFEKLKVKNIAELIWLAFRHDFVDTDKTKH